MYPSSSDRPKGKLRLLYECNPMAFVVEQAGGKAIDDQLDRIMSKEVTELHQKSSIAIGSPAVVEEFEKFIDKYKGQ